MCPYKGNNLRQKTKFSAHTSFLASSPFLILLGYLAMVDAAFLHKKYAKVSKDIFSAYLDVKLWSSKNVTENIWWMPQHGFLIDFIYSYISINKFDNNDW